MLNFYIGDFGSEKSTKLYNKIKEKATANASCLFVIPEQFGFEAERIIYEDVGALNFSNVYVAGFSKLASKIIAQHGSSKIYADDLMKELSMYKALTKIKNSLSFYSKMLQKDNFCEEMLRVINSLKNAGVTPARLQSRLQNTTLAAASLKMDDILAIYTAYNEELLLADHLDDLTIATDLAQTNGYFVDKEIFIDDFDGFTGAQYELLSVMIRQAKNVTIAITTTSVTAPPLHFVSQNYILNKLTSFTLQKDTTVTLFTKTLKAADFSTRTISAPDVYAECDYIAASIKELTIYKNYYYNDILVTFRSLEYKNILSAAFNKYEIPFFCDTPENIVQKPFVSFIMSILKATSLKTDDILAYIKSGFVRISDSGVSQYKCQKKDVKVPLNGKHTFAAKPQGIKRLLKKSEINDFENFVRTKALTPNDYAKPFAVCDNYRKSKSVIPIERLRTLIISPLMTLKAAIQDTTGDAITKALTSFLIDNMQIKSTLNYICTENTDSNISRQRNDEYRMLWEKCMTIFESFYKGLKGFDVTPTVYLFLLKHAFANTEIAKPPQVLDCVSIGELNRIRPLAKKAVFVCGINDKVIPQKMEIGVTFTAEELEQLIEADIPIDDNRENRYSKELFIIEKVMRLPNNLLIKTFPLLNASFEPVKPSPLLANEPITEALSLPISFYCTSKKAVKERLATAFSKFQSMTAITKETLENILKTENGKLSEQQFLLALLKDDMDFITMLQNARREALKKSTNAVIDKNVATKLFQDMKFSPSSIEMLGQCPFQFFLKYGLHIYEPLKPGLTPLVVGNTVHYVLANGLKRYYDTRYNDENMKRWKENPEKYTNDIETYKATTKKWIEDVTGELLDEYIKTEYNAAALQGSGFLHNVLALSGHCRAILSQNIADLAITGYVPKAYETAVAVTLSAAPKPINIAGKCDRYDILEQGGKKLLRIVDYKTGDNVLNPCDISDGLNLQPFIYMYAVAKENPDFLPKDIFFMPSSGVKFQKTDKDDIVIKKFVDKHRPSGLEITYQKPEPHETVTDFGEKSSLQEALSTAKSEDSTIIELEKAYKSVTSSRTTLSQVKTIYKDDFDKLQEYWIEKVKNSVQLLKEGHIDAAPNNNKACKFCPYKNVCS